MQEKTYDIHERIFKYVIAVVSFLQKLPKTSVNLIFIGQCTRSVTSMGANDQEADGTLTKNDFIHGCTTVRKEGKETVYWLRVIGETNTEYKHEAEVLVQEGGEIVAIMSTIIKNTMKNSKKKLLED